MRFFSIPERQQLNTLWTVYERKSLEKVFSIAYCRQSGDKWQLKNLFWTILDLRSWIVLTFSIAT